MNDLVVSRKGKPLTFLLILSAISLFFAIFSFVSPAENFGSDKDFLAVLNVLTPLLLLAAAVLCFMQYNAEKKTHITVHESYIEGIGVNGMTKAENFRLNRGEYTATTQGAVVFVTTSSGKLRLRFSAEDAAVVFRALTDASYKAPSGNNTQTAVQKCIRTCPQCSAKCQVPVGRGHIVITCPKCGKKFETNT